MHPSDYGILFITIGHGILPRDPYKAPETDKGFQVIVFSLNRKEQIISPSLHRRFATEAAARKAALAKAKEWVESGKADHVTIAESTYVVS